MMAFIIILAIVVVFVAGWFYVPKGRLTKITATASLVVTSAYDWLSEQWFMLQMLVPPEWTPWFVGLFLALTVAAAVRPATSAGER